MRPFAILLAGLLALPLLAAPPARAACDGRDLRDSLTLDEQADWQAALDATPYAEGNHWLATRGEDRVHLVGTFHLDDPRLDAVAGRLAPVLARARLLLAEMSPEDQQRMQRAMAEDPGLLTITEGPTLIDRMPEAEWARLAEAATARGIPPFMAAKFKPWYLSVMLAMPPCLTMQFQGAPEGLDARVIALAEAQGVPVRSLEPYDTVLRVFGAETMDEQIAMLRTAILPDEVAADSFATLVAAYFEERHAAVWQIGRVVAQRHAGLPPAELESLMQEMRQSLLTDRNRAWLPVILQALEAPGAGPVVVAAGAAHLTGAQGLPALLEAAGFTLERRPF